MSDSTTATPVPRKARPRRGLSHYAWVWAWVLLIYVVMLIVTPTQASLSGLAGTTPYIGVLGFVAVGQALVIMQRGIDFSVTGTLIVTGMVLGKASSAGMSPIAAIALTLLIGVAMGLANGAVVLYLRITPLIATLAMNSLFLGVALIMSSGSPVNVSNGFAEFGRSRWLGVSPILVFAIVAVVLLTVVLNRTATGRWFRAVGSSPATARASGLPIDRYVLGGYALAGLCYGCAGLLLASYIGDSRMAMGGNYLMAGIAAVVIGGTPLTGGRGSLVATFGGAVFMTLLQQFVLSAGVSSAVQMLIQAIVIIVAAILPKIVEAARRLPGLLSGGGGALAPAKGS